VLNIIGGRSLRGLALPSPCCMLVKTRPETLRSRLIVLNRAFASTSFVNQLSRTGLLFPDGCRPGGGSSPQTHAYGRGVTILNSEER
jgi:hypothetical protein